jgi:hypothetical protein
MANTMVFVVCCAVYLCLQSVLYIDTFAMIPSSKVLLNMNRMHNGLHEIRRSTMVHGAHFSANNNAVAIEY